MRWLFVLLAPLAALAQTTLNFTNLANMGTARGTVACASDSDFFYVANGFSSTQNYSSLLEKYNVAGNSWSVLSNSLIPKQAASAMLIGSYLYVFNGIQSGGILNEKVEVIDVNTGAIVILSTNPAPASLGGAAVWNGSIYIFGGSIGNTYSKKLYRFDPATQTWTQLADMLQAMETMGEIVNGKLYTIGGFNGADMAIIDMYDIATDTWTHMSTLPYVLSSNSTAVHGTKIYSAFDFTNQTYLGFYDIITNTYTTLQETNMIGRRHGGARIAKGKLYIMAGNTGSASNSCLSSLQEASLEGTTTGIREPEGSLMRVYPNPASNLLHLENCPEHSELTLVDATGKTVAYYLTTSDTLDVSQLKSGLYTIKLITPSGNLIFNRFIRQ